MKKPHSIVLLLLPAQHPFTSFGDLFSLPLLDSQLNLLVCAEGQRSKFELVLTSVEGKAMYNDTIKTEAAFLAKLGDTAIEDQFHALYSAILTTWFPTSEGYMIDHQIMGEGGKPEYIVVRRVGKRRNPLLIVELKRPERWNNAGKEAVLDELSAYAEGRFRLTEYDTIYLLGGIGLHWKVWKMEKSGLHVAATVEDWHTNISSNNSFAS